MASGSPRRYFGRISLNALRISQSLEAAVRPTDGNCCVASSSVERQLSVEFLRGVISDLVASRRHIQRCFFSPWSWFKRNIWYLFDISHGVRSRNVTIAFRSAELMKSWFKFVIKEWLRQVNCKMGKRKYNEKGRQVVNTIIDNSATKQVISVQFERAQNLTSIFDVFWCGQIKLDIAEDDGGYGGYDQSNALVLPSQKRGTKIQKEKETRITRILSKKQRKNLEKIVDKKKKKEGVSTNGDGIVGWS